MTHVDLDGARCAVHPDREALGACRRCGNFACQACGTELAKGLVCAACAETVAGSRYHAVPVGRFAFFQVATFGGYGLYWFWKNWSMIKHQDGSDIWPVARAIFASFSYFALLEDLNTRLALRNRPRALSPGLAIGYLVWGALWRLPDPYWLISLGQFAFLLPAVSAIRGLASDAARKEGARWRVRHTILAIASSLFMVLGVFGALLPEP